VASWWHWSGIVVALEWHRGGTKRNPRLADFLSPLFFFKNPEFLLDQ